MEHIRIPVVREDVDTNVVIHFHVESTNEVIQLLVDMNVLIHFMLYVQNVAIQLLVVCT